MGVNFRLKWKNVLSNLIENKRKIVECKRKDSIAERKKQEDWKKLQEYLVQFSFLIPENVPKFAAGFPMVMWKPSIIEVIDENALYKYVSNWSGWS